MIPAQKALWYVEGHLSSALTLDEIASVAGVSRFHMVRAFGEATGMSVMRYVRGRRLTEAARKLAGGAPDILSVALDVGYSNPSHLAQLFRRETGLSPSDYRGQR